VELEGTSGTAKYLKEQNPNIRILGVGCFGSVLKKYHETREFDNDEFIHRNRRSR
jgi:cystathionine beta-synthase